MTFFLILLIGIVLIVINLNAIKKDKKSFHSMLGNKVDNMEEFEVRIGEIRRDMAETMVELQEEIQELKDSYQLVENAVIKAQKPVSKEDEIYYEDENKNNNENSINVYDDNVDNNNKAVKIKEIRDLVQQGMEIDEIAQKLQIGKGEVLLIQELYLK